MYVIEQWNGRKKEDSWDWIVAGFATLQQASDWCHMQNPTDGKKILSIDKAFDIYHVEGDSVELIPFPWDSDWKDN